MIRVKIPIGTKVVAAINVRTATGMKVAPSGWVRIAEGLRRIFTGIGSISVTASPADVSGFSASATPTTITTNATIALPSGGAEPYTYAWAFVSSDGGTWSIQSASSASTKFNCAAVGADITYTATFRCTVTDTVGGTGTVDVLATASNLGNLYP